MRAGRVVHLRVSPKDCMRVVDALGKMGIVPNGTLSFSHAVKKVMESCLYALERDSIIPVRDGFEYLEMMKVFPEKEQALQARAAQIKYTDIESHPNYVAQPIVEESYEQRVRRVRYDELMFKRQQDEMNFSEDDLMELASLIGEFQK